MARARHLFGTDGIRGTANTDPMTAETALRLGQAAEQALEHLAIDAESRPDFAAASNWWRRLVEIDALKARAVLGLMESLVARGDRAEALRTADHYAQRVREDLDGEPNARIVAYASSLRGTPSRLPVIADEMIE